MGHAQYLAAGHAARARLFGLAPRGERAVPLNMLISQQGKISRGECLVRSCDKRWRWFTLARGEGSVVVLYNVFIIIELYRTHYAAKYAHPYEPCCHSKICRGEYLFHSYDKR